MKPFLTASLIVILAVLLITEAASRPAQRVTFGSDTRAGRTEVPFLGPDLGQEVGGTSPRVEALGAMAERYRGTATFYCSDGRDGSPRSACTKGYGPDDLVAAIDRKDSEFRKGDRVLVRFGDKAVTVTIVDVCACVDARVIDLTVGAFQRLAPWHMGVLPVTIEAAGSRATLPPTHKEEER
jgi:hypothetical protein